MKAELTAKEIQILSNYRFVVSEPEKEVQIDFKPFLDESMMGAYLKKLNKELKVQDMKATASVFMKRHAFLAVLYLYSITAFNKKLDVSPENIILADVIKDGLWLPEFYLKNKNVQICPDGQRDTWRMEAIRHLFVDNLVPVMDAISKAAKISKLILLENIAVYIFWLYEKILSDSEDHKVKERAAEDFSCLLDSAPGELSGNYEDIPLARYHSQPVYREEIDSYIRVRTTCCYSYMLNEKGGYCKTCPRTIK